MNFYYRKNFPCATFSFDCISYHIPKPHHATQHSLRISIWTIRRIVNRVSAHFHTALPSDHFDYLSSLYAANRVNFSHRYQRCILRKRNSCSVCRGFWMGCSTSVFKQLWSRIGYHSGSTTMNFLLTRGANQFEHRSSRCRRIPKCEHGTQP